MDEKLEKYLQKVREDCALKNYDDKMTSITLGTAILTFYHREAYDLLSMHFAINSWMQEQENIISLLSDERGRLLMSTNDQTSALLALINAAMETVIALDPKDVSTH